MALVEINEKSAAGRKELERLRVLPFAKIIEKDPSPYGKEFVEKIRRSEKQPGVKIDLDNLWK